MANIIDSIFGKLKTKFNGLSPSDLMDQGEIDSALDQGKTITMKAPKSERYTYLPNVTGTKELSSFKPKTREEKDTLAPIGFFRVGELEEQRNQKIAEAIKKAAEQLGRKKLTKGQEKLVRMQAESEQPYTQDVPSTAIDKVKYDPKTQSLYVNFVGGNKTYWYPRVPKEKVEEMMAAPSKGEYFMQNIHDQYSVNYQLHGNHNPENTKTSNRHINRYYKKMQKAYNKGMKKGTMTGVLNK
jgi:hypothetical protein